MKWRIPIIMSAVLMVGFCMGIGLKWIYETNTFRPYEWRSTPIIMNCYGEDFSELQMTRAIGYWTLRGHQVDSYVHNPPREVCETEGMIDGTILLKRARWWELEAPTLANTQRMTSGFKIVAAVITYRAGAHNLNLLNEHELGHALGYGHIEEDGHIMHPIYGKMTEKFWIP